GSNKDGFIQRAFYASRAYTNIIDSVNEAEAAANQANKAAMDAMELVNTHNTNIHTDTHTHTHMQMLILKQSNALIKIYTLSHSYTHIYTNMCTTIHTDTNAHIHISTKLLSTCW